MTGVNMLVSHHGLCEEGTYVFGREIAATGIVVELVLTNVSHGERACLWVRHHKPTDGGVGTHGSRFGECDAYIGEMEQGIDVKVDALVGQGGVPNSWSYALETFCVQVWNRETFVGSVCPYLLAHLKVKPFRCGFGETVGYGLCEKMVVCVVGVELFYLLVGRCGKQSDAVPWRAICKRPYKVGEAQARCLG